MQLGPRRYGSGIASDTAGKKFVLTYDRTGKLLSKHEVAQRPSKDLGSSNTLSGLHCNLQGE